MNNNKAIVLAGLVSAFSCANAAQSEFHNFQYISPSNEVTLEVTGGEVTAIPLMQWVDMRGVHSVAWEAERPVSAAIAYIPGQTENPELGCSLSSIKRGTLEYSISGGEFSCPVDVTKAAYLNVEIDDLQPGETIQVSFKVYR